jgi:tRNA pseudouridine38-40 synthase
MRIALGLEYQGDAYKGWQRQSNVSSVQQKIEDALSGILRSPISITSAGRTDAGVHATGQVVHFDTELIRPEKAYTRGMNTLLPKSIAVRWVKEVGDDFHARYSATSRRYRYVIYSSALRPGILNAGVTHIYQELDADLMHEAAQFLLGEHDFSSFRAAHCQAKTPVRTMHAISVVRKGSYILVDVEANAFLHHMIRNIVGALLLVGQKERPPLWLSELLSLHDRGQAPATAKPNGLYLVKIVYPDRFDLPEIPPGPLFIDG